MAKIDYSDFGIEIEGASDYLQEFDPLSTPVILAHQIQEAVDSIISNCQDVDWSEDLISSKIIEHLRSILASYKLPDIIGGDHERKFNVEAYKLTGKAEQSHGDIAVIVTRKFQGQMLPISGVAFYEAKASGIGHESYRYPSFSAQQLRRLVTHTPKLSYLIYNREKQEIGSSDWLSTEILYDRRDCRDNDRKRVHAVTIDANFLKQHRRIANASLIAGQSFGAHFVTRVLSGRDLDYSRSVEQIIRRWLKITKRSAPLIVSVSVHEKQEEQFSTQLELPGFEKVQFSEISYQATHKLGKNDIRK